MGIDQSPPATAMKFAQQPRSNMAETARIGLALRSNRRAATIAAGSQGCNNYSCAGACAAFCAII
jgi:hypothetical protein